MSIESDWFPGSEPEQLIKVQNIEEKIDTYQIELDLTAPELAEIHTILQSFIAAVTQNDQIQATAKMMTTFKNQIKGGEPKGSLASKPPTFQTITMPTGATLGTVEQIRDWRNKWVLASGYTPAIGADLMIIGTEHADKPDSEIQAALKYTGIGGYTTEFKYSLQGMNAMGIEWRLAGTEEWHETKVFTSSPAQITVTPTVPNQPLTIEVRARLMRKNQFVGQWSPIYTIYVTP